jgi:hypothetical protein
MRTSESPSPCWKPLVSKRRGGTAGPTAERNDMRTGMVIEYVNGAVRLIDQRRYQARSLHRMSTI